MTIPTLPSLRNTLERYDLLARKSLGQHFLLDPSLLQKIVQSAGDLSGMHVAEVGPGPGGLTRALLQSNAAHVYAIEKDARCHAILQVLQQYFPERLTVYMEDASSCDLMHHLPSPRAIVANLPYNIGTLLLLQWLEQIEHDPLAFTSLTLMFQQEVADRLTASPGSKAYGRLSVRAQWLCEVSSLFDVPAAAFTPPPKVVSSVVQLRPHRVRLEANAQWLEKILAASFGQRRKMLRGSLKGLIKDADQVLMYAGVDPMRRPETLTLEEFCRLSLVCRSTS